MLEIIESDKANSPTNINYAATVNPEQELINRTKRQLSLESQVKINQGATKLQITEQAYHSEPMTIDLSITNQS